MGEEKETLSFNRLQNFIIFFRNWLFNISIIVLIFTNLKDFMFWISQRSTETGLHVTSQDEQETD